MIELDGNRLVVRFPEVHPEAVCRIEFQRTLRIPDDNREYPLPPGLGQFPLLHTDDFAETVPPVWIRHGGVFFPMYQAEATWINFHGSYPFAIKVAAGKINAVTGEAWQNELNPRVQDYLVVPDQPWLDGFCVAKGTIRQFVAMPLGSGYSAEEQITGEAEFGGVQVIAYPMKRAVYEALPEPEMGTYMLADAGEDYLGGDMGLAPGGLMRQSIYDDEYGFDAWETSAMSRFFVHIVNSLEYVRITGHRPPAEPPTALEYTKAGLPWFEYYAADRQALAGAKTLAGLDSIAAKGIKKGETPLPGNDPVHPVNVKQLHGHKHVVREGEF